MPETKHTTIVYTTTIILSSIFFFIFGLTCGQITRLCQKRKKSPLNGENSPDYEVVPIRVPSIVKSQEMRQEVHFQPNEAYGQIMRT